MHGKIVLMVMDSVGIGELPDAIDYGDEGSNTLGNIIKHQGGLNIPNLTELGIGNIMKTNIPYRSKDPVGCYGKAKELSAGKDTTTGHWEIAGIVLEKPFPVYSKGFPDDIIIPFKNAIGRDILWNKPASGSGIINTLGDEHIKTGSPIVYTSADSVFQIAAHEDVIPINVLYDYCRKARNLLKSPHNVGRVIARPFKGTTGNYYRTKNRSDFSLSPVGPTILDILSQNGFDTVGVGKISDIFAGQGISRSFNTKTNDNGLTATIELLGENFKGLIFTNLVDFDMLYGHRNDVEGYAAALEALDLRIPEVLSALNENDIIIITADHGCDPTTESTDHSREYIPILVYGKSLNKGVDLGILESFSDIGATILDIFNVEQKVMGTSFKDKLY